MNKDNHKLDVQDTSLTKIPPEISQQYKLISCKELNRYFKTREYIKRRKFVKNKILGTSFKTIDMSKFPLYRKSVDDYKEEDNHA